MNFRSGSPKWQCHKCYLPDSLFCWEVDIFSAQEHTSTLGKDTRYQIVDLIYCFKSGLVGHWIWYDFVSTEEVWSHKIKNSFYFCCQQVVLWVPINAMRLLMELLGPAKIGLNKYLNLLRLMNPVKHLSMFRHTGEKWDYFRDPLLYHPWVFFPQLCQGVRLLLMRFVCAMLSFKCHEMAWKVGFWKSVPSRWKQDESATCISRLVNKQIQPLDQNT